MTKQAEQDLGNAIDQERVNNPTWDDDLKHFNKVSDLVSYYLFDGKGPSDLVDDELKKYSGHVANLMNKYYQSKNPK